VSLIATDPADVLVGRERELEALDRALGAAGDGAAQLLAISGEPGIGKSRLVAELGRRADAHGCLFLDGRSAEFERERPFAVLLDACDEYLESLDARTAERVAGDGVVELAQVFPSLRALAPTEAAGAGLVAERYRAHQAFQELLERLAVRQPVVLALDDLHWADGASTELLAHLLRRPPRGRVILTLAFRSEQAPRRLASEIGRAAREGRLEQLQLGVLGPEDAERLLADVAERERPRVLRESGGNPFYLDQLARGARRGGGRVTGEARPVEAVEGVPGEVALALAEELESLSPSARGLLEAAAVAGEPFEVDLVAPVADLEEESVLAILDELLDAGLLRPTQVPRRFVFRHPIVRHAVYAGIGVGWRLGAHARAAEALAAQGASPAERAHHVEHAARRGDMEAVAVLYAAAEQSAARAPAAAARWLEAALRLLPAGSTDRAALLVSLGAALGAAGDLEGSRAALLEALDALPADAAARRVELISACAAVEHWLGRHDDAHRRLTAALTDEPAPRSREAARLHVALAVDGIYAPDYPRACEQGRHAYEIAEELADPILRAESAAALALATAAGASFEDAERYCDAAAACIDGLADGEVAECLEALFHLGWAETYVERFATAVAHLQRGVDVSRTSAQSRVLVPLMIAQGYPLSALGRTREAVEVLTGAVDAARLSPNPQHLFWALAERAWALLWTGDLDEATRSGEEAMEAAAGLAHNMLSAAQPGSILAAVLLEAGDVERGGALLHEASGGPELAHVVPAERFWAFEELAVTALMRGDDTGAADYIRRGEEEFAHAPGGMGRALLATVRATLQLRAGDAAAAASTALAARAEAAAAAAEIVAARAGIVAGRALAAAGETERALAELTSAEQALHACGSLRWRDEAARELRQLGKRVDRRGRTRAGGEEGSAQLTAREREIAELVTDRLTNPEIAARLFLSEKTVETHLRNVFRKLDVSSRTAVARAVERERKR
jgi:DNA-binding NarL/FixJ family response regulator